MKLKPEHQYMLFAVVGIVILSVVYFQFMIKPITANIAQKKVELETKTKDLENAKAIVAKYAEFKKRAASVQREFEVYQEKIPTNVDKILLMDEINSVQGRSGVVFTNITMTKKPADKTDYSEVPVDITFGSTYHNLLSFLYQTTQGSLMMTVGDLRILITSTTGTGSEPNTLSASMVLKGIQAKGGTIQ